MSLSKDRCLNRFHSPSFRCIVRATAGSACDRFGPRWTYAVLLLCGAIPTALAGTVTNARGLIALRCFIGILGAGLVPCEVWTTGFFDKNVVGAANAFAAGWGNAGGGITYFAMPAIFDSLVKRQHLTPHQAWRVAFVVPFLLIMVTALGMVLLCPDTPTGKWSERRATMKKLSRRDIFLSAVTDRQAKGNSLWDEYANTSTDDTLELHVRPRTGYQPDKVQTGDQDLLEAASWELVEEPTFRRSVKAIFSLPTFAILAPYFCSFGSELSIISFLGSYYHVNFPHLTQTGSGNWASMFGLLNFFTRPAGGVISDLIYRSTGTLWGKKILIHFLGLFLGVFLLLVGFLDPHSKAEMFGLMVGLAFFSEASNGAGFALVPHVHPTSNGSFIHSINQSITSSSPHSSKISFFPKRLTKKKQASSPALPEHPVHLEESSSRSSRGTTVSITARPSGSWASSPWPVIWQRVGFDPCPRARLVGDEKNPVFILSICLFKNR